MTQDGPASAANIARNDEAMWWRRLRWRSARSALWGLLEGYVNSGTRVAVVGAGGAQDVPLRRLCRRAQRVDLIDLDAGALRRVRARSARRARLELIVEDVTLGAADAITHAAIIERPLRSQLPPPRPVGNAPYDVVIAGLLYTQLLYPALVDAGLSASVVDDVLVRVGQPLTDAVVARLHASAPDGLVIHLHDVLAWWAGHQQPFTVEEVLAVAQRDQQAALERVQSGEMPIGCDPRQGSQRLGAEVIHTAFWRWPFSPGVDYLVCATVTRT